MFSSDAQVLDIVTRILLDSWPAYERYTGPLGAGTLTDIIGPHYGPGIESSERNGWGQWHRANGTGVGMDRTSATGTGFISQYSAPVAAMFESVTSTPDELLLFFHHVPYGHVLRSGTTVIQHIYDTHFAGAARVAALRAEWASVAGRVDPAVHARVAERLDEQLRSAQEWRDQLNTYFWRKSGIPDAHGRPIAR